MLTNDINNLKIILNVGQLLVCLSMGAVFAGLSYATWLVRGRTSTYFLSQFFALGFIFLAVLFLLVKLVLLCLISN
jgi:hypothetical protein